MLLHVRGNQRSECNITRHVKETEDHLECIADEHNYGGLNTYCSRFCCVTVIVTEGDTCVAVFVTVLKEIKGRKKFKSEGKKSYVVWRCTFQ